MLSIIIYSGDKAEWVWPFWKKHWIKYYDLRDQTPVYFLTEEKLPPQTNALPVQTGRIGWSKGLKNFLKKIKDKYILYLQEDYFLTGPMNTNKIHQLTNKMDKYNIHNVKLYINPKIKEALKRNVGRIEDLVEYPIDMDYQISLQPGIWNKETFLGLLKDNETPWDLEIEGTKRMRKINKKAYICTETIIPYIETVRNGKPRKGREKYLK